MAPLVVGDFVTTMGTFANGVYEINSLTANLGIFTTSGTKPAYVTVESAIFGIIDPAAPAGEAAETRSVAWTTDLGSNLAWFAMDVDPCTGSVTERTILTGKPNGVGVVPQGRIQFRNAKTAIDPSTRQVGFRLSTGTATGPSNITAGQFIQPVFDFIFPELTAIGSPMFPLNFNTMPFLAKGSGPYVPGKVGTVPPTTPVIVGPLSPWPGVTVPPTQSCAPISSPTTTLVTSTTSAPASTSPVPKDTITVTTATTKNKQGSTTVTVAANSNNTSATLNISLAGTNPVASTAMTPVTGQPGFFTFTIVVKSKPTSFTITSQFGGTITQTF
jgi:hypothetical protein